MNPKLVESAFVPEDHVETNDAPKSDFLCHRWYVNRWSRNYRCAGGATSAALRRNQGSLRTGGIRAGRVPDWRRSLCGLHCAHLKGTPPTTQGHQALARDRFAACCSLQSAESK